MLNASGPPPKQRPRLAPDAFFQGLNLGRDSVVGAAPVVGFSIAHPF